MPKVVTKCDEKELGILLNEWLCRGEVDEIELIREDDNGDKFRVIIDIDHECERHCENCEFSIWEEKID
tara:strand:- start:211 stop:417 length:207 start_codon:yes stop_codon:yes gene_type:complete